MKEFITKQGIVGFVIGTVVGGIATFATTKLLKKEIPTTTESDKVVDEEYNEEE